MPVAALCAEAGLTPEAFDAWWRAELAGRLPQTSGAIQRAGGGPVEILRDSWGIPHILAATDEALFFGFGFAMAQDRLWQMDYLRRRALGQLAEVLGPEAVGLDVIARTVGLPRIARAQLAALPPETAALLEAFASGVNACIEQRRARLPIEFALLDYTPAAWAPLDSVAIWGDLRWYLTGRLFVIAFPEVAKRILSNGALYRAFLMPEAGDETILAPGSFVKLELSGDSFHDAAGAPGDGAGSNNWAVDGRHSATGRPLLASDPHIAFGTTSCWHEVHLDGGSFHAAGMAYVGVPVLMMGRTARVAWGFTNNICSQRDLYQERTDPQHPGCYLYDGRWEPAQEIVEEIWVRDGGTVRRVVRSSRNGPIVDELLPEVARGTGPVSLRWVGAEQCDELSCALAANRAQSVDEFREALRSWRSPTLSFVAADTDGHIGYQSVGRIPIRENWDRGYRPGWDPEHQWQTYIPYDGMPEVYDPPLGWVRSANNLPAPPEFPYSLSNTSGSGHRARRIRQMLEGQERFAADDFARMQMDTLSLRAVEGVPPLVALLEGATDAQQRRAVEHLRAWDCRMEPDAVGPALFELFFNRWSLAVAEERFPQAVAAPLAGAMGGLALALLSADPAGWFTHRDRRQTVRETFRRTIEDLQARFGPDPSAWSWGRVHTIALRHVLSGRGELGQLLDRGGYPVRGSGVTVCNTGYDPNYMAVIGANYRLIVDLASTPPSLRAVDAAGASGDPGSPHYCDQLPEWLVGRYHEIVLDREHVRRQARSRLVLEPGA